MYPVKWLWIDTCCINKDSAAELSEAINSMFRWYLNAAVCLAYVADVEKSERTDSARADSTTGCGLLVRGMVGDWA